MHYFEIEAANASEGRACYDGHTPGELQRRRLATGAEKGSFMSISQEVFQQAPAYYAENPVTQRMLLCAADRACAYASQAAAACAEYSRVVAENERLQHQLAQRQTAEDAYRELWLNSDRYYTFDRTGRAVELLNSTFEWAARVIARPPFSPCDDYIIKIRGVDPSQITLEWWQRFCFGMLDLAKRGGWSCTS